MTLTLKLTRNGWNVKKDEFFSIGSFFYGSGRFLRFHRCNWANVHCKRFSRCVGNFLPKMVVFWYENRPQNAPNFQVKELAPNFPPDAWWVGRGF